MINQILYSLHDSLDFPNTDNIISVASEQVGTIHRPGKASAGRLGGLLGARREFRSHSSHLLLLVQIVEDDGVGGGDGKSVGGGREGDVSDFVIHINVEVLEAGGEIPDEDLTVLTSRSTDGTIGRDGDLVDKLGVTNEVVLDLHGLEVPDLDDLIVTAGDHARGLSGGDEAHAADPIVVTLLIEGVLAFTEGVPELDVAITTAGHDQTVIGGEADGEDVLAVTNEGLLAFTGLQVPETDSVIPSSRESIFTIVGDADILDNVRMTVKGLEGSTVGHNERGILNDFTSMKLPDHTGLITGRSDDGVSIDRRRSDGGDPSVVALKATAKANLSRHVLKKGISTQFNTHYAQPHSHRLDKLTYIQRIKLSKFFKE